MKQYNEEDIKNLFGEEEYTEGFSPLAIVDSLIAIVNKHREKVNPDKIKKLERKAKEIQEKIRSGKFDRREEKNPLDTLVNDIKFEIFQGKKNSMTADFTHIQNKIKRLKGQIGRK